MGIENEVVEGVERERRERTTRSSRPSISPPRRARFRIAFAWIE